MSLARAARRVFGGASSPKTSSRGDDETDTPPELQTATSKETSTMSAAAVDHTAAMAAALPDLTSPASTGTMAAKALSAERATFSDAKGLGEALPDLSSLTYVKGEPVEPGDGPLCVFFWAKYAKGDYRTMVHFSYLKRALPELATLAISCDAEEADAAAMLKKMNTAMPTQSLDELIFEYPLAFDGGKTVRDAFAAFGKPPAPGFAFLFHGGKLVWKEVFTSSWALKQGQFAEQCALLLAGAPLLDNGPRPAPDDDDEDEEAVTADVGDIPGVGDDDY